MQNAKCRSLSGDSNPRPAHYEWAALPTELKRQNFATKIQIIVATELCDSLEIYYELNCQNSLPPLPWPLPMLIDSLFANVFWGRGIYYPACPFFYKYETPTGFGQGACLILLILSSATCWCWWKLRPHRRCETYVENGQPGFFSPPFNNISKYENVSQGGVGGGFGTNWLNLCT